MLPTPFFLISVHFRESTDKDRIFLNFIFIYSIHNP